MQLLEHCTHSTEAIVKWIFIENAHANSLRIRGVGQTSAGTGPYIHIHTHSHINSVIHTHWETAHAHHQAPINAELHIWV